MSCGSGGGSSSNEEDNSETGLSKVSGVWRFSSPYGPDDEWYFHIDEDGVVSYYDYLGDPVDNIANCYYSNIGWATITHLSGDTYELDESNEAGPVEIEIVISMDNALIFTSEYENEDSISNSSFTPSSLNLSDFTPICDDSVLPKNNQPANSIISKYKGAL